MITIEDCLDLIDNLEGCKEEGAIRALKLIKARVESQMESNLTEVIEVSERIGYDRIRELFMLGIKMVDKIESERKGRSD